MCAELSMTEKLSGGRWSRSAARSRRPENNPLAHEGGKIDCCGTVRDQASRQSGDHFRDGDLAAAAKAKARMILRAVSIDGLPLASRWRRKCPSAGLMRVRRVP